MGYPVATHRQFVPIKFLGLGEFFTVGYSPSGHGFTVTGHINKRKKERKIEIGDCFSPGTSDDLLGLGGFSVV